MSWVFVLDSERRPLTPVHPGRARWLLTSGKAAVLYRYPFTLILKQSVPTVSSDRFRLKIDPGSKTTGVAVVDDETGQVLWAGELTHRGSQVTKRLTQRRVCRQSRRRRHTRYRPARFQNRRRKAGWLSPSLQSRLANVLTWVRRLSRLCPIGAVSLELVKFDTQLLHQPEISGTAYQQGELAGYEVREYLLEKWERTCAYCGKTGVPLQVEHLLPKSRGGSDQVSNLAIACQPCNQLKGDRTASEFGHPEVEVGAKRPLRDAAAVNTMRWALWHQLKQFQLPLEEGTGGRTKWNRTLRGIPKTHWTDAVCVGSSTPPILVMADIVPLLISAQGRHSRQMCRTNRFGFPDKSPKQSSVVRGLRTGDIVQASVPSGHVHAGKYVGRIAVRATGSCDLKMASGTIQGIHARYCRLLHRADGYRYEKGAGFAPSACGLGSPRSK